MKKQTFVNRCTQAVCAIALAAMATATLAQQYPSRSVRIVIPFEPGGGSDLHARALANELGKLWKQSLVPENIGGAGGGLAASNVARSKPDGHTIFFATHPILTINPILISNLIMIIILYCVRLTKANLLNLNW